MEKRFSGMRFISNGDFLLPLHFPTYWAQHLYTWSYERGAANPDGILRLPGRLVDIAVFAAVGNVGFGYFYLASCLAIAFVAFWWFAKHFLEATRWGTILLGALFFALNPIFLGNLSKVGLILAVAMLPVALTALKLGFEKKQFSYFLLFILALNISLLHPFTFAVNLVASGTYAVLLARTYLPFMRDNLWKFALLPIVGLLLHAYCILPLASLGTLDKGALSDTVASTPVDYTSLVDIANTGDIFTGLSLSKSVLKDYEFYGPMTWPFYFLGVFMFYALLFGAYVQVEKRAKPRERRRFVLALGIFLALLVMATASYLYADVFIKLLIGLPGGWMFRSPLKWQLYMPIVLFTALVIALKYVRDGWRLNMLYAAFGLSFLLMNGYLFKDIYNRLLTPRTVTHFAALHDMNMDHKNLLFADSGTCMSFARDNPAAATELNEVLISKPLQVKHVQAAKIDTVNVGQYDFVMGCADTFDESLLTTQYAFAPRTTFINGVYALYENTRPAPYVGAAAQVFAVDQPKELGGKHALASSTLAQPFSFISEARDSLPTTGLQDPFDDLSPRSIADGGIYSTVTPLSSGRQQLFIKDGQPLFSTTRGTTLQLSVAQEPGAVAVPGSIDLPAGQKLELAYRDSSFSYQNLIGNASLEDGLWQKEVGDCNAYDKNPSLDMRQHQDGSEGKRSLQLTAKAHIACTGPNEIAVQENEQYLLSFDYQTKGGQYAGYYAGFDNLDATSSSARLPDTNGAWEPFTTRITTPAGATQVRLLVYAYTASALGETGMARYDNFKLIRIPNITNRFFVVSGQPAAPATAPQVAFTKLNPTKTVIHIKGGSQPFYLTTKESYNHLWQLRPQGNDGELPNHIRLNGTMNGWRLTPKDICKTASCVTQADGSYDMTLVMEFAPQRWFYLGTLISATTAAGMALYVGYDIWQRRQGKGAK